MLWSERARAERSGSLEAEPEPTIPVEVISRDTGDGWRMEDEAGEEAKHRSDSIEI